MKLINSSYEILEQSSGYQGILEQIERAGRTCYKSEDKAYKKYYLSDEDSNLDVSPDQVINLDFGDVTVENLYISGVTEYPGKNGEIIKISLESSAEKFVNSMIKSFHGAMLEHGTVYLYLDTYDLQVAHRYEGNPYSKVVYSEFAPGHISGVYITTNYRVLVENDWLDDLKYLCKEPLEYHEKRVTVKFICDRGVSHELVRHRVFSFAQESQRYCNYSKDKYSNEITFICPSHSLSPMNEKDFNGQEFIDALTEAESHYLYLIKHGWTPQQARAVLPNATKTEVVMTGFISDWKHFFDLRADGTTGAPHPDMKKLALPLKEEFINRGYLDE